MAIATGTALLIGAGVAAAGKAGSSYIQSRASGKATEAGLEANREALDWEREQAEQAAAVHEEEWRAWNAERRLLMQRYGIDIASLPNAGPSPGGAPGAVPRAPGGGPVGPGRVGPGGPMPGPIRGQGQSVAALASAAGPRAQPDLRGWNDWSRMGLGRNTARA